MPTKFDIRKKHLLLSEERFEALQPGKLLRSLGLRKGMTLADIGCGPGFFTLPAAEIVGPDGQIFAADIQGEMLTTVRERVAEAGLSNVRIVKTSDTEVPLPAASCDIVLLAFVLHEIGARASFLHKTARILKPTGRVIVMEWRTSEEGGSDSSEPITLEDVAADAAAAGLRQEESRDLGENDYICVLTPAKS